MPKLKETILIDKDYFKQLRGYSTGYNVPSQNILDEWFDNVEKANQIFYDITPYTITTSDDGLGMNYETFCNDFVRRKDSQGFQPNSTGVFGIGGSKGIPFLIGRPLNIGFKSKDGKSYYKGVWEYDGEVKYTHKNSTCMFPLNNILTASVKVYSITESEYRDAFTRECGYVPSFTFAVERLHTYLRPDSISITHIRRALSVKMMEMKQSPNVTLINTKQNGKTESHELTPAYHNTVFQNADGNDIIAPYNLDQLPFSKTKMDFDTWTGNLKAYKRSNVFTEGDTVNEEAIKKHRAGEFAFTGEKKTGMPAMPNRPVVAIYTPAGRILHRYLMDSDHRSSHPGLMNFMMFCIFMDSTDEQVPFRDVKAMEMMGHVQDTINDALLEWMQKPAQIKKFTHNEGKGEDKKTEELRNLIVSGQTAEAIMARGMLSSIIDCGVRQLEDPNIVKCQVKSGEVRALDLKIETPTNLVIERKLDELCQSDIDQAVSMSYYLDYKHHMVLLTDKITPHGRDNAISVLTKRMQDDTLGKAVSFTVMTQTSLTTGAKSDTDFIELYRHEDYV